MAATNLSVINQICIDLGGTGGHVTNLTGINEICTILGATSGHVTNLSGLNAICTVMGYTSGHVTNLRALNEICTGGGGTGGHFLEYNAWVEIQVGALLNYFDQVIKLLGSNLKAYWLLNEASGNIIVDSSGNGINCTYLGTPVFGADGIATGEKATNFNAAAEGQLVYTPGDAGWTGLQNVIDFNLGTVALWVNMNDASYWNNAVSYGILMLGVSTSYYYYIVKSSDGKYIYFHCKRNATISTIIVPVPKTARWVHLAISWSTAADSFTVFLNGAKIRPKTNIGTWVGTLNPNYGRLADTSPGIANINLNGKMAHVVVTNNALPNSTIKVLAKQRGQLFFVGDSRTESKGWTSTAVENAYPTGLYAYGGKGVAIYAISGATTQGGPIGLQTQVAEIISLIGSGDIVSIWCGVNDGSSLTAAQIYANLQSVCNSIKATGAKAILCTEIDSIANPDWHNVTRAALNILINADHSFADAIADLWSITEAQDASNRTNFIDETHPTDLLYNLIQVKVKDAIVSIS